MALAVKKDLLSLPSELLEHICNNLSVFDISRLEQVCKTAKNILQYSTRVWRLEAERLQHCFRCPLTEAITGQMKLKQIFYYKYYKIIIGIIAQTKSVVADLQKIAADYKESGEQEMVKLGSQGGNIQTEKQFTLWLKRIVRVFIQEELMKAKIEQILGYKENMNVTVDRVYPAGELDLMGTEFKIPEDRVNDFFTGESPDVTEKIKEYEIWIKNVFKPTDDEILKCAEIKRDQIVDMVRDGLINM